MAIIREEGSNGDREMGAAVFAAGMEPWDVTMSDLLSGRASLDSFQGAPATRTQLLSLFKARHQPCECPPVSYRARGHWRYYVSMYGLCTG